MVSLQPNDHAFITQTDEEDRTTVVFGDGRHGARLPTGVENVRAKYRTGIGRVGNVPAEQISLLAAKPLGVKEVINPLPAAGGADREARDQIRHNVPLAMMTLDRLVSVRDYADFARTYAGIGKASAVRLPSGSREIVHVTIAGADDGPITRQSDLYRNLTQALRQFGDPYQPFRVDLRQLILLVISARVRLQPDHLWASVEPKIRAALTDTFSFDRRELGQDALYGEAVAAVQAVPGVAYVDVDVFDGVSEEQLKTFLAQGGEVTELDLRLRHRIPVTLAETIKESPEIRPAQLAILSPEVRDTLILLESDQ
jgi:predicted phage baseplate assembly protein